MATTGGKYASWCTLVREGTKAQGAIIIVIDGIHGEGFSVQAPLDVLLRLPKILRHMADEIEEDNKNL